ncbi:MAG: lysine--tRNA ligase [Chloroflexi bacterium]|nr:lysine--tRNA ligase [Chloroflexota bacterium]
MSDRESELLRSRREKLERLRARGVDPYPPHFHRTHTTQQALELFQQAEAHQGATAHTQAVTIAGRITAMRGMGRASFLDLRDGAGRLQAHLRSDILGAGYNLLTELDLGDFLGTTGPLFKTRRGEVTLEATVITLLAKALAPPPEKWHGLKDVEVRYRQRYLDLMANPEVAAIFRTRSRVVAFIRRFMDGLGFMEVETPVMVQVAAGAMAKPFVTKHNALDRTLFLRIATELHLKRLIVGGMDKVYEIGKVFRNEGIDLDHNPEFTTMESYEAYADYHDVMRMVEELVSTAAQEVLGKMKVAFHDHEINLAPPWQRLSLVEALRKAGVDIERHDTNEKLVAAAAELGVQVQRTESRTSIMDKLVGSLVEPKLIQPTFLVDYPVEMSPLAKAKPGNPRYVERFEAFIGGMEVANAFTELNDPDVQRQRFEEQEALRRQHGEEEFDRLDEDFLESLEYGMPPTGGLGVGIDRLVMVLTGQRSIRDVVLFPQLRSLGSSKEPEA